MVRITNYRRDISEFQFDDWADDIVEDYESSVRENEKITKKMNQESLKFFSAIGQRIRSSDSERFDWSDRDFIGPLDFKLKKLTTRNGGPDFDGHHR